MIDKLGGFAAQEGLRAKIGEALRASSGTDEAQKQKVAQEFASLLVFEVLKAMRATIPQGGLFEENSLQRDIYTSLTDMELSRAIAKSNGLGLAKMVEKALDSGGARPDKNITLSAPTKGLVSSQFGLRVDPSRGEERLHKGVDIAAPAGSPVRAAATGKVVYSAWSEGYGNLIAIDHGHGLVTRYAHNAANLVSVGQQVQAGQTVGLVGSTGRSTAPHLHFEVLRRGEAVDPLSLLELRRAGRIGPYSIG
jgi:murein DD-endopeptidase MepM/ murein hydrolase activator NlpD